MRRLCRSDRLPIRATGECNGGWEMQERSASAFQAECVHLQTDCVECSSGGKPHNAPQDIGPQVAASAWL